jgi:hypothetical protein
MLCVFFWIILRCLNFIWLRFGTLCLFHLHRCYLLCNRTHHYPVTLFPIGVSYFRAKPSPVWIPQLFSNLVIIHLLAYEDGTECSETSAHKIQTPGNYPGKTCNIHNTAKFEINKKKNALSFLYFSYFAITM